MNLLDRLRAESEAAQSFIDFLNAAEACKEAYERASMALPEPLKRFLSVDSPSPYSTRSSFSVPAPKLKRPPEAEDDWAGVDVRDCSPTALIPAILREGPMSSRDAIHRAQELNPSTAKGSLYNAGTKLLKQEILDRTDDGLWHLRKPEAAGFIFEKRFWGNKTTMPMYELAAHRRDAILHILQHFEMGLEVVQLVEQLTNCSWVIAPVNKDLLKADVQVLESEGKIRRRGNTRKWEIAPPGKGDENKQAE
jgi:hypothetical protein